MNTVVGGDSSDAVNLRSFNRHIHRHRTDNKTVTVVAVERCGRWHFSNNFRLRSGVDFPLSKRLDVSTKHVRNAVGFNASNVGVNQHFGSFVCLVGGHTHL